jgi:DNA-binding GntR family transcriptional regulator
VILPCAAGLRCGLRAEGLIESRHGIGTFVNEQRRLQRLSRGRYGAARGLKSLLSHNFRHDIVFVGRGPAPAHIAEVMGLDPGTDVVIRRRHLYGKDTNRPEEIGASYLPVEVAGGTFLEEPTVVPKALFLCVEDLTGRRYTRARDQWIARMPTTDEASILELPSGAPVMHVGHTARDEDGDVLEVSESIWPADRVILIDDYPIEQEFEEPLVASEV